MRSAAAHRRAGPECWGPPSTLSTMVPRAAWAAPGVPEACIGRLFSRVAGLRAHHEWRPALWTPAACRPGPGTAVVAWNSHFPSIINSPEERKGPRSPPLGPQDSVSGCVQRRPFCSQARTAHRRAGERRGRCTAPAMVRVVLCWLGTETWEEHLSLLGLTKSQCGFLVVPPRGGQGILPEAGQCCPSQSGHACHVLHRH